MTEAEEFDAWRRVRVIATNIIGFYDLTETPDAVQNEVQRLDYEAQVYAGGVALARLISEIMANPAEGD